MILLKVAKCVSYIIKETFLMAHHVFWAEPLESIMDLLGLDSADDDQNRDPEFDEERIQGAPLVYPSSSLSSAGAGTGVGHTQTKFGVDKEAGAREQTPPGEPEGDDRTKVKRTSTSLQTLPAAASASAQTNQYKGQANQTVAEVRNNFNQSCLEDHGDGDDAKEQCEKVQQAQAAQEHAEIQTESEREVQTEAPTRRQSTSNVSTTTTTTTTNALTGTTPSLVDEGSATALDKDKALNEQRFLSHVAIDLEEQRGKRERSERVGIVSESKKESVTATPAPTTTTSPAPSALASRRGSQPALRGATEPGPAPSTNRVVGLGRGIVNADATSDTSTSSSSQDDDSLGWFFGFELSDKAQSWVCLAAYLLVLLFLLLHLVFIGYHHYTIQHIRSSYNFSEPLPPPPSHSPKSNDYASLTRNTEPSQDLGVDTNQLDSNSRPLHHPVPHNNHINVHGQSDIAEESKGTGAATASNNWGDKFRGKKCGNCGCKHRQFTGNTNAVGRANDIDIESHRCQYIA